MKPIDVLAAFLQACEAKDIEAIAPMLADDVRLQDWNRTALGKQAVLAETSKKFKPAASTWGAAAPQGYQRRLPPGPSSR